MRSEAAELWIGLKAGEEIVRYRGDRVVAPKPLVQGLRVTHGFRSLLASRRLMLRHTGLRSPQPITADPCTAQWFIEPLWWLMQHESLLVIFASQVGFAILFALGFGSIPVLMGELLPRRSGARASAWPTTSPLGSLAARRR